jgi:ADP-heptose:LPS heptosyltransferase
MRLYCKYPNSVVVLPGDTERRYYQPGWHEFTVEQYPHVMKMNATGNGWRRPTWEEAVAGDRVAIVRDAGLGDFIMLSPTLRELKQRGLEVILYTYPKFADVYAGTGLVDSIHTFPEQSHPTFPDWIADFTFDLIFAVDAYDNPATRDVPRVDRFGMVVLGRPPEDKTMEFSLQPYGEERAAELLAPLGSEPFVAFGGRSWANSLRGWPADYIEEAARLLDRQGVRSVWVGVPLGREQSTEEPTILDLRGQTSGSVHYLAGILARAEATVTPDTGILHLSAVLRRPTLALFGPSNPTVLTCYYDTVEVLRGNDVVSCPPCLQHTGNCEKCMRALTPQSVVGKVQEMLPFPPQLRATEEAECLTA